MRPSDGAKVLLIYFHGEAQGNSRGHSGAICLRYSASTCSSKFIVTVCRQKHVAELRRFGPDRKWKIRLPPAGHAKSVNDDGHERA
jgi:hypothetical protein